MYIYKYLQKKNVNFFAAYKHIFPRKNFAISKVTCRQDWESKGEEKNLIKAEVF